MRVLLITDSLGCPREEIGVKDTWTDRILTKWSSKNVHFYTYCKHGLVSKDIDINYVKEIEPDLIIIQVGIVDACRRALSRRELAIISHIPIVRRIVNIFCNKYHYMITRVRNVHYCTVDKFEESIRNIYNASSADFVFLSICSGGGALLKKIYNIQNDINNYNYAIKNISGVSFLDPYKGSVDAYILPDGHHLNLRGQEMVFQAVDKVIENFLKGDQDA